LKSLFSDPKNLRYRLTLVIPMLVFLTSLLSAFVSRGIEGDESHTSYAIVAVIALFCSACSFFVCLGIMRPLDPLLRKVGSLVRFESRRSERGQLIEVYHLMEKVMGYLKSQGVSSEGQKAILRDMERLDYLLPLGYMSLAVAHEVRNPLTTIRGMSELLMARKGDPDQEKYLETILGAAGKIEAFTTQLLDLTDDVVASEPMDLNEVVEEALQVCATLFPGVHFRFQKKELPVVTGDRTKLYQAFQNIIKNAFEVEKEDGFVEVSASVQGHEISVSVYNRSSRIDPGDEEMIFKPFFTRKKGGKGLGLFISLRNVRLHGGTIDLLSERAGVTFVARLPFGKIVVEGIDDERIPAGSAGILHSKRVS
jgi:signal transduction histidine kinase